MEFVLQYLYYAGFVCIGLQRFERALEFFEQCIAVPSWYVVSAFAVEAYKKYILVSLILYGELKRDPGAKWHHRHFASVQPYQDLVKWIQMDTGQVQKEQQNNGFVNDGNCELVQLFVKKLPQFRVKRLSGIYSKLSLVSLAQRTGLTAPQVESLLLQMVRLMDLICPHHTLYY